MHKRITYANVVSTLALVAAMGAGGAHVAAELGRNSVGPKQLKPGAVKSRALANGAVSTKDLSGGLQNTLRVYYIEFVPMARSSKATPHRSPSSPHPPRASTAST